MHWTWRNLMGSTFKVASISVTHNYKDSSQEKDDVCAGISRWGKIWLAESITSRVEGKQSHPVPFYRKTPWRFTSSNTLAEPWLNWFQACHEGLTPFENENMRKMLDTRCHTWLSFLWRYSGITSSFVLVRLAFFVLWSRSMTHDSRIARPEF